MSKFVKRYPRAVIQKQGRFYHLHLLEVPGERVNDSNRLGWGWPHQLQHLQRRAHRTINQHRKEVS